MDSGTVTFVVEVDVRAAMSRFIDIALILSVPKAL